MKRKPLLLVAVALVSFAAGGLAWYALQYFADGGNDSGETRQYELYSIPLTALDGGETRLEDWRAEILVVNFWAPWCAPCRREIPALIDIQHEFEAHGVRILGIAFDGPEQVRRFADDYDIEYPLFVAGNGSPMYNAAFDNPSGSLPFTALLDRELRIFYRHNGEMTREQLRTRLEQARQAP